MENPPKKNKLLFSLSFSFKLVLILWVVHLVQVGLGYELGWLGIYPRRLFGLRGVLLGPFIHGDFGHLISNSIPLFVLSAMILFFYRKVAIPSMIMIFFLTGLAVWSFGRPVFHIGASGVIYGLVAFVFWNGVFRRNVKSIALALVVAFYYGSMFVGILPGQEGISWESHLLGALAGIFTSFWYMGSIEDDEQKHIYSWEKEDAGEERYFLDPDTFEKTKAERLEERETKKKISGWFSNRTWE